MEISNQTYVFLFFIFLAFSAFVGIVEVAYLSVQKSRLKHLTSTGVRGASEAERITQSPDRLLATTLFINNVVQTAAAAVGTVVAVRWLGEQWGVIASTVGIAFATLILAEAIPKTFSARHSERLALLFARPFRLMESSLSPVVSAISWLTTRVTGGGLPAPTYKVSEEEIRSIISEGEQVGAVEEDQAEMLHNVFEFGDRRVSEVMTPRTEVVWLEKGTKFKDFLKLYMEHPHSRFPVYHDSTDNVVGILAIRDVLIAQARNQITPEGVIDPLVRPAAFVPETKQLSELLNEMQASGSRMAVVVDEYGGIAGVATLQAMIEEIVGEIRDELVHTEEFQAIDEHTFEVEGGMTVDVANEELGLKLPQGEYETVAGFVLSHLGHIPRVGEQFKYDSFKLFVTNMRGLKVEKVRITRLEPDSPVAN
ncbi:MAG: HlyC/CorC family transporter [Chloroflexi bacterium]|nr:HlyC/CorC family transporter [Chloroflexota bacterium]